jgi:hypothetical protein
MTKIIRIIVTTEIPLLSLTIGLGLEGSRSRKSPLKPILEF